MKNQLVFVYGSLRAGYWNNHYLKNSIFLGPASTVQPFGLYVGKKGAVPVAVPNEGDMPLYGEVYEVDSRTKKGLDILEYGYDQLPFAVNLNGEVVQAIIYHQESAERCAYMRGGPELIPGGDYTTIIDKNGKRVGA